MARPNSSPIELNRVDFSIEPSVASSTAFRSLPLRKAIRTAVRSAMPSCSASDCGSSASYRSGAIPSRRACAVSCATMSRDRLVWTSLPADRNEKNCRLRDRRS
jgi:hypothetical protein